MARQCVVGIYETLDAAKQAIETLEQSNFPSEQVSLVTHSVERQVPEEEELQYGDQAQTDAAKGAGIGGLVGVLLGAPLLAIPGIGPVLLAGPIAAGMTGAIVGGFLGALTGWGVHEDQVAEYEEKVREGATLVVADGDPQEVAEAQRTLKETDATRVDLHAKTSADDVNP